jgi:hypothetical protein
MRNEINQAVAEPATLHIKSSIGAASDRKEINHLSRLVVRDHPNLAVTPIARI